MGCSAPRLHQSYNNKYDDKEIDETSGPYVRSNKVVFDETEKNCQDKTLIEALIKSFIANKDRECMGYRKQMGVGVYEEKFSFFTYAQVLGCAESLAKNLRLHGLASRDEYNQTEYEFIGIYSRNCVEWVVTDIACQLMSITTATFYSTLGEEAFEHICNQTKVATICISPENAKNLITYKQKYGLKYAVNVLIFDITEQLDEIVTKELEAEGFTIYLFSKMSVWDSTEVMELKPPKPDTTLTICYTSGTTSLPKGAELTQRNFFSEMAVLEDAGYSAKSSTTHLSYLPLAHVMERICIFLMLGQGGRIGFITGDVKKYLRDDLKILQPTILIAVPRVLSTFRQSILDGISKLEGISKSMADGALETKRANLKEKGDITHGFYDTFVFNKIRDLFGGKIEAIVTGSAPLSKEIGDDIKILLSVPIMEAYGMTECTGGAIASHFTETLNDSAGGCIQTAKIKLVDVIGTNYSSKDMLNNEPSPSGEICISGPIVFKGYYKNSKATSEAFDKDGWLHTGDVGRILPHNKGLKIIDRIKEIFKLSQGEYIAPSKLEGVYSTSKYVMQICICGDSTKNHIVAIVIPNQHNVREFIISQKKWTETSNVEDFYGDNDLFNAIAKDFDDLAKENKFNGLEKVNSFIISNNEFTVENGCLTSTMKLVRRKVAELFKNEIDQMYA